MASEQPGRRKFIKEAATGVAVVTLGLSGFESFAGRVNSINRMILPGTPLTGFDQQPLPYAYNALEDVIDTMTMEIHYSKHAAGYSKNLKEAAKDENVDTSKPVEKILANISAYSTKMRNNAGGHYNHEMFWKSMRPKSDSNAPKGNLMKAIEKQFSSFDLFKESFAEAGKSRFGSGWAWLYLDGKTMKIGSTPNQDNPLMNTSEIHGTPLLGLDVWEHAYYLKYQNKRADYIQNWWKLVNWDYVQERFDTI